MGQLNLMDLIGGLYQAFGKGPREQRALESQARGVESQHLADESRRLSDIAKYRLLYPESSYAPMQAAVEGLQSTQLGNEAARFNLGEHRATSDYLRHLYGAPAGALGEQRAQEQHAQSMADQGAAALQHDALFNVGMEDVARRRAAGMPLTTEGVQAEATYQAGPRQDRELSLRQHKDDMAEKAQRAELAVKALDTQVLSPEGRDAMLGYIHDFLGTSGKPTASTSGNPTALAGQVESFMRGQKGSGGRVERPSSGVTMETPGVTKSMKEYLAGEVGKSIKGPGALRPGARPDTGSVDPALVEGYTSLDPTNKADFDAWLKRNRQRLIGDAGDYRQAQAVVRELLDKQKGPQ